MVRHMKEKTIVDMELEYSQLQDTQSRLAECLSDLAPIMESDSSDAYKFISVFTLITKACVANKSCDEKTTDIIELSQAFKSYGDSVLSYKKSLEELLRSRVKENIEHVKQSSVIVKEKQNQLVSMKNAYKTKYNICIDSYKEITFVLEQMATSKFEECQDQQELLIEKIMSSTIPEESILINDSEGFIAPSLPNEQILIGERVYDKSFFEKIGIQNQGIGIYSEIRDNGNICINIDDESSDLMLNRFIIAYIFKYIESFPLGCVNVHLFSKNIKYCYRKLYDIFHDSNYSDVAKKCINVHSSISELDEIARHNNNDVVRKTSTSVRDLFSLYETDQTDPFNLFILLDGLYSSDNYSISSTLETIKNLTTPGESGHRSGLRFLIVNRPTKESRNSQNIDALSNGILNNCEIILNYDGMGFNKDENIKLLDIIGDFEEFIERRSHLVASTITNQEKRYLPLSEIIERKQGNADDSIIRIPIGKSGNDTFYIPLSCNDELKTFDGRCVGYMVIGQSGSGKSSFFHNVVISGCYRYSPKDLQYWLLDFKFGGASSKYRYSSIPHVKIVAEDNKIDDALCLFQMVFEEMEKRNRCFNKNGVSNIIEYNRLPEVTSFPRIIILIDEVQEIFGDDNASVIKSMIAQNSNKMRSVGMHFIMIAQSLCDRKAFMLKEAFLQNVSGKICFRVAENVPGDSGYGEMFTQRKKDIIELPTGEAFVSVGQEPSKVMMAYSTDEEKQNKYFPEIREMYADVTDNKPLVIGVKERLKLNDSVGNSDKTYYEEIADTKSFKNLFHAVIGEDSFRVLPVIISFSPNENSSLVCIGSNRQIASSICFSTTLSLLGSDSSIHLFNGDRSDIPESDDSYPHPFKYLCSQIKGYHQVLNHKLSEFAETIGDIYSEYLRRQTIVQDSEDSIPPFQAIFLIVNDLMDIKSVEINESIAKKDSSDNGSHMQPTMFGLSGYAANTQSGQSVQSVLKILLEDGYRYNIHTVMSIVKVDRHALNNLRLSSLNNLILCNNTQYSEELNEPYYIKEMLRNISNEDGRETMAVWVKNRRYSKIRPIIPNLYSVDEKTFIDSKLGGALNEKAKSEY